MLAGIGVAVVSSVLAAVARVLCRTEAAVGVDSVQAGPAVPAGDGRAVVNVHLTVLASKAGPTVALEVVNERLTAAPVLTLVPVTLVYLHLAPLPAVARPTLTEVAVDSVQARGAIQTRLQHPRERITIR